MKTSTVTIPRSDGKGVFEGYVCLPDSPGASEPSRFPGVLVIHEIFGLNDNIRGIAERFAGEGYAALAVDLFAGRNRRLCMMQAFYGILFSPLKNAMLSDLEVALQSFGQMPEVDGSRIGAVGFCMGGGYALQLAVTPNGLKAASVFYGSAPKPLSEFSKSCPILGSYPEKDFTSADAHKLEEALTRYEIPHDIRFYQDTQHSFFNRERNQFEVEAARDSWQRMLAFFSEHVLGGAAS